MSPVTKQHYGYRARIRYLSCLIASAFFVPLIAGCASSAGAGVSSYLSRVVPQNTQPRLKSRQAPIQPALISLDNQTGALEYWEIQPDGSQKPIMISPGLGISSEYGMAADGNVLAIASYSPSEIVTYDLKTQAKLVFPDPHGPPIDIAIAKGDTIFALNAASITSYPVDRSAFRTRFCQYINNAVAMAVDNEADVFVNGYGPNGFIGIVEYTPHSQSCTALNLKPELGYAAGVGVDPQTDDLIVVDDPNSCGGSNDGRMTVYSKPYEPKHGVQYSLNGVYCAGTFRLDETSQNMFLSDSRGSGGIRMIDQMSYPKAAIEGTYGSSDPSGGVTTLPNTLPN